MSSMRRLHRSPRLRTDEVPPPNVKATVLDAQSHHWLGWLCVVPELGSVVECGPELEPWDVVDLYEGGSIVGTAEGVRLSTAAVENLGRVRWVVRLARR